MATQTHIDKMKAQYRYNTLQVLWLTGMTEEQFYSLQYETGLSWLEWYTGDNKAILNDILSNEMIWSWWVNQWCKRDNEFFLAPLYNVPKKERLSRYRQLHQQVFTVYTPSHTRLEQSYALAVGLLFDTKNK